jgi:hypothetical protein
VKKRKRGAMTLVPVGKYVSVSVDLQAGGLLAEDPAPPPTHGNVDTVGPEVTLVASGDEVYFSAESALAIEIAPGFVFVHESNLAAKFVV